MFGLIGAEPQPQWLVLHKFRWSLGGWSNPHFAHGLETMEMVSQIGKCFKNSVGPSRRSNPDQEKSEVGCGG